MPPPSPFGALVARAVRLCARRWAFYLAAAAVAFGLQAAFLLVRGLHYPEIIGGLIVGPLLALVVFAFAGCDATGEQVLPAARWGRVLERSWAVIVIDLVSAALTLLAIDVGSSDPGWIVLGALAYGLLALTIFADVNAALEPNLSAWWLIPRSFQRSAQLATQRHNVFLTLTLLATYILVDLGTIVLSEGFAAMHPPASDWWLIGLETVVSVPYAALVLMVYFECLAREKAAANGNRD
ncbi:MAG TPA: hypothetical protein VIJ12_06745 [Candidatus Baltobacteraceae bacterium]